MLQGMGRTVFDLVLGAGSSGGFTRTVTFVAPPKPPNTADAKCVRREQFAVYQGNVLVMATAMNMLVRHATDAPEAHMAHKSRGAEIQPHAAYVNTMPHTTGTTGSQPSCVCTCPGDVCVHAEHSIQGVFHGVDSVACGACSRPRTVQLDSSWQGEAMHCCTTMSKECACSTRYVNMRKCAGSLAQCHVLGAACVHVVQVHFVKGTIMGSIIRATTFRDMGGWVTHRSTSHITCPRAQQSRTPFFVPMPWPACMRQVAACLLVWLPAMYVRLSLCVCVCVYVYDGSLQVLQGVRTEDTGTYRFRTRSR